MSLYLTHCVFWMLVIIEASVLCKRTFALRKIERLLIGMVTGHEV